MIKESIKLPGGMEPLDLLFDMETADPDDVMTLCLAANHSCVHLRAVTVTPGTDEQIGLVKMLLSEMGLDIPVGSRSPGYSKNCVSKFHTDWLGKIAPLPPNGTGHEVILQTLRDYPGLTVLTGAPLKNFEPIASELRLERWVAQGGFAGDNIVPPEYRLEKFVGRETCPTFNFNGAPQTAEELLNSPQIRLRQLVSKNVCHGVIYDAEMHARFRPNKDRSAGLRLMFEGMEHYLENRPTGKKFHDPLALAVAIDPSVCEFREVQMYRRRGEWGALPNPGSGTFISIRADVDRMIETLTDTLS